MLNRTERVDRSVASRRQIVPALRLAGFLGFAAGFLFAYQRSSRKSTIPHLWATFALYDIGILIDSGLQSGFGAGQRTNESRKWILRS